MIDMHSKYDNMHKNGMFYALIYINNHVINSINFILSFITMYPSSLMMVDGHDLISEINSIKHSWSCQVIFNLKRIYLVPEW